MLSSLIATVRAVKVECIDCGERHSQYNAVGGEFLSSLLLYPLISNEEKLVNFIEQSQFKNPLVSHLFRKSRIFRNTKTHCGVHKSPPLVTILNHMCSVNMLKSHS